MVSASQRGKRGVKGAANRGALFSDDGSLASHHARTS
jgi:hypothetical protein